MPPQKARLFLRLDAWRQRIIKLLQAPSVFTLWGSDVEVLWHSLLGGGATALLRRDVVQHDGGQSVTCRVVGPRQSSCDVSLQRTNDTPQNSDRGRDIGQRTTASGSPATAGLSTGSRGAAAGARGRRSSAWRRRPAGSRGLVADWAEWEPTKARSGTRTGAEDQTDSTERKRLIVKFSRKHSSSNWKNLSFVVLFVTLREISFLEIKLWRNRGDVLCHIKGH